MSFTHYTPFVFRTQHTHALYAKDGCLNFVAEASATQYIRDIEKVLELEVDTRIECHPQTSPKLGRNPKLNWPEPLSIFEESSSKT